MSLGMRATCFLIALCSISICIETICIVGCCFSANATAPRSQSLNAANASENAANASESHNTSEEKKSRSETGLTPKLTSTFGVKDTVFVCELCIQNCSVRTMTFVLLGCVARRLATW
jgi:hypothetical protein